MKIIFKMERLDFEIDKFFTFRVGNFYSKIISSKSF